MAAGVPKHIFIVEDNEIYSMMLDYILSKDSIYKFVSFKSGEECLKNLYLNPDIIILDYGLPGIDGYQTLLEIKKSNPHIHVVMLSSHNDQELVKRVMAAGADDFILKQGHGEAQIIEKIEHILMRDEWKKKNEHKKENRKFMERLVFFILIVVLITLGIFL